MLIIAQWNRQNNKLTAREITIIIEKNKNGKVFI